MAVGRGQLDEPGVLGRLVGASDLRRSPRATRSPPVTFTPSVAGIRARAIVASAAAGRSPRGERHRAEPGRAPGRTAGGKLGGVAVNRQTERDARRLQRRRAQSRHLRTVTPRPPRRSRRRACRPPAQRWGRRAIGDRDLHLRARPHRDVQRIPGHGRAPPWGRGPGRCRARPRPPGSWRWTQADAGLRDAEAGRGGIEELPGVELGGGVPGVSVTKSKPPAAG